jgi:thiamin-phosphate kinase
VLELFGSSILVATTDYVNAQPIIMTLGIGSYFELGRYLVNCNLADLCGSGAEPLALLISIMWDRDTHQSAFDELVKGAGDAAARVGAAIVGGDTKLSSRASFGAVAFGTAHSRSELFLKNRARPEDGVWVSGPLGSCAAAVLGWDDRLLADSWRAWAREALANPSLPIELARGASALAMDGGGTDISDGLGADLSGLCDASHVGVEVHAESIPVADPVGIIATQIGVPPYAFAFTVGGDLQFLISADNRYSSSLEDLGLVRIGTIHGDPRHRKLVHPNGTFASLPSLGHRDANAMTFREEVTFLLREQGYQ